jgi:hypothetical protein
LNKYLINTNSKNYELHNSESNANFELFFDSQKLKEHDISSTTSSFPKSFDSKETHDDQHEMNIDHLDDEYETEPEDHESLVWTIFLHLLKLIAEVVL